MLCDLAGVSRSGYYAYLKAEPKRLAREAQDLADFTLILEEYKKCGYEKGAREIKMRLARRDPPVIMSRKKINRLMNKYKLSCPVRRRNARKKFMQDLQAGLVAPNIVDRNFNMYGARIILLTDVTYLIHKGGTAYLSAVLDGYTHEILAYVVSPSLEEDFILETVNQLVDKHGISFSEYTILHSDQGCQYTSHKFIDLVRDKKLRRSMSRKACCWDNAPMESFWGHMKDYIGPYIKQCTTFNEVKEVVDKYIDYYNNDRPQMELAALAPSEFYKFYITGIYPYETANPPARPVAQWAPEKSMEKELAAAETPSDAGNNTGASAPNENSCCAAASACSTPPTTESDVG